MVEYNIKYISPPKKNYLSNGLNSTDVSDRLVQSAYEAPM